MIDWSILNIEETTDESVITQAYRRMLTVTNPEDNPNGFMVLRNTYEEALKYARNCSANNVPQQSMMGSQPNTFADFPMENTNAMENVTTKSELDKTIYIDNIKDIVKKKNRNIQETVKLDIPLIKKQINSNLDVNNLFKYDDTNNISKNNGIANHDDNNIGLNINNEIDDNYNISQVNDTKNENHNENILEEKNKALENTARIEGLAQECNSLSKESKVELTPMEIWINNIESVYNNFEQRISIDIWQQILEDPVCVEIDSRMDATDALLTFLMQHYNLPQKIWILLDKTFGFKENEKELLEKYPKEFIEDVVISSIDYQDIIDYDLFVTGLMIDYDQFIFMFFDLVRMIREGDMQGAYEMFMQIDSFGSVHPYVEVERVKYYINIGQLEPAAQIAMMLYEQFPQDASIIYIRAEVAWAYGNIPEAKAFYERLLEINNNHYYAKLGLADCYMQEKDYEKAKDMYTELKEVNPYDTYVIENIDIANNQLIELFEKKTQKDKEDVKIRVKLAWCYLQKQDVEKAINIGKEIEKMGELYEACNILGRCYLSKKDHANAIKYLEKWVECIRNIPRNGNVENTLKYSRLGKAFVLLGQAYELAGKEKKALSLYKLAVKEDKKNINHKINLARYQLDIRKFEDCINTCEDIIKIEPRNFDAIYYRAVALFNTDHLSKALDGFEECLDIYQYDISSYVYKIRILLKYCEYDKVNKLFEFLDKQGIGSDALTFYKTKMDYEKEVIEASKKSKDEDEIDYSYYIELYEDLLSNYKNEKSDIDDPIPLYIEMANLYICTGEYKRSLAVLKNVHEKDKNNVEVYECMAICFENLGETKAAIESYKRILILCPDHREANIKLAVLYDKQENYNEAIKYHSKQLDITKSIQGLLDRGLVYLKMSELESARKDFKEAVKMNPYNPISYNYLGVTYLYDDNYEEALKAFEKAVERIEQEPTPIPYRNLAITYVKLKDIDKAVECYENNIKQFNDPYDYEQIAILLYEQKRYKESVEAYTKKSKLEDTETSNIDLYIWVGKCNTGLESENTALKYYTKAIKEAKMIGLKSNKAYIQVAKMYMELGKYELATKFFEQVKAKEVMTIENKLDFAYSCMNAKNFSEAQNIIKKTMKEIEEISDKDIAQLARKNYLLAYALWVQGNYAKANEHLNKVFTSRKCESCKYSMCYKAIALKGLILEKTGDIKGGIKCMKDALDIVPGNSRYIHEYNRMMESSRR